MVDEVIEAVYDIDSMAKSKYKNDCTLRSYMKESDISEATIGSEQRNGLDFHDFWARGFSVHTSVTSRGTEFITTRRVQWIWGIFTDDHREVLRASDLILLWDTKVDV